MRIGYLHLSPHQDHESGVTRYGRYLATSMARHPNVEVMQAEVTLTDQIFFGAELDSAIRSLASCDVLHLQYSKYIGLTGWNKLRLLHQIRRKFAGIICISLHDIYADLYPEYDVFQAWEYENRRLRQEAPRKSLALRGTFMCLWQNHLADKTIMRWILQNIEVPLVCTGTEAERLQHFEHADRIQAIPHFVEERSEVPSRATAKRTLGWPVEEKVITIQGFIYRGKGHQLLLEAVGLLRASVRVIFAGGMAPNQVSYEQELREQARKLELGDRFQITGYLSETELELYLAASDLAVCPYRLISASGSLATWLSIGRPILAYNLPQIQELNAKVPGSIQTFDDYTPKCLAARIQDCLNLAPSAQTETEHRVRQLQSQLSLQAITTLHLQAYRKALRNPDSEVTKILQPELDPQVDLQ